MKYLKLILLLSSVLSASCQEILFSEDEESREIRLHDFSSTVVSGIFNIVLVQDSTDILIIKGRNNISHVEASVINDTLYISDTRSRSLNPARNTLYLHFSSLNYLLSLDPANISGSGLIISDVFQLYCIGEIAEADLTIRCGYLSVLTSGNTLGAIHLSGTADECSFVNRYGSSIAAGNLTCRTAGITNESVGDVTLNVTEKLVANITGSGNIYYYADPEIEVPTLRGGGMVIRIR